MESNNSKAQKFAKIALIGAPNAGKSTLTNFLVQQKISIVSPKVQTTRNNISAILTEDQTQILFLDTPGIFIPKAERPLERSIVKNAWSGIKESDFVCFVIDATQGLRAIDKGIFSDLTKHEITPTIILNKTDLVAKERLLEIIAYFASKNIEHIFPISAKIGDGVEALKNHLMAIIPECPWNFSEDEISMAPMKFLAAEITREKLFLKLKQDLPYSLCVQTEGWQVLKDGSIKINQTIFVLKDSQKSIILGKNGCMIKEIGAMAREDISKLAGNKIHLYLFVKIQKNWLNNKEFYGND